MNRRGSWLHILGAIGIIVIGALLGAIFQALIAKTGIFDSHPHTIAICAPDKNRCDTMRTADEHFGARVLTECVPYKNAGTYQYLVQIDHDPAGPIDLCENVTDDQGYFTRP